MSERVERLKQLANKATPGKWTIYDTDADHSHAKIMGRYPVSGNAHVAEVLGLDNAEFLCALRNAAPALLAVVEAAQKEFGPEERHGKHGEVLMWCRACDRPIGRGAWKSDLLCECEVGKALREFEREGE